MALSNSTKAQKQITTLLPMAIEGARKNNWFLPKSLHSYYSAVEPYFLPANVNNEIEVNGFLSSRVEHIQESSYFAPFITKGLDTMVNDLCLEHVIFPRPNAVLNMNWMELAGNIEKKYTQNSDSDPMHLIKMRTLFFRLESVCLRVAQQKRDFSNIGPKSSEQKKQVQNEINFVFQIAQSVGQLYAQQLKKQMLDNSTQYKNLCVCLMASHSFYTSLEFAVSTYRVFNQHTPWPLKKTEQSNQIEPQISWPELEAIYLNPLAFALLHYAPEFRENAPTAGSTVFEHLERAKLLVGAGEAGKDSLDKLFSCAPLLKRGISADPTQPETEFFHLEQLIMILAGLDEYEPGDINLASAIYYTIEDASRTVDNLSKVLGCAPEEFNTQKTIDDINIIFNLKFDAAGQDQFKKSFLNTVEFLNILRSKQLLNQQLGVGPELMQEPVRAQSSSKAIQKVGKI